MQGTGNDYLYFDCFEEELPCPDRLSKKLSDRHRSVGGDGIILLGKSAAADASMRIFNADGSEGEMCGNGIRCAAKFLYEIKGIRKEFLTIETRAGVKKLFLRTEGGKVARVTVDMGLPVFEPEKIPADFEGGDAFHQTIEADGESYPVNCLSMGNPHCVIFWEEDLGKLPLERIGPKIERHRAFPARTNVEFVRVLDKNRLQMRVFERGSGETFSCGTGACAAAVAAVRCGYAEKDREIEVLVKGGELSVKYADTVLLTGEAEFAFRGTVWI